MLKSADDIEGNVDRQENGTSSDDKYLIRSLVRALGILRCFDASRPSWRLTDLAKETGLDRGTCFRMVKTMENEGFLELDEESSRYHLGRAFIPALYLISSSKEFQRIAHPFVLKLAEETTETAGLAVWSDEAVVFIDQAHSGRPFRLDISEGTTFTDWRISHVRVFAAFGPGVYRERVLAWNPSITDYPIRLRAVESELDTIRAQGIAYDLEEHRRGIAAVAAPVWDEAGRVAASLAVVVPAERFSSEQKRNNAETVLRISRELSRALGWVGSAQVETETR